MNPNPLSTTLQIPLSLLRRYTAPSPSKKLISAPDENSRSLVMGNITPSPFQTEGRPTRVSSCTAYSAPSIPTIERTS
jgi:hypothetical protein